MFYVYYSIYLRIHLYLSIHLTNFENLGWKGPQRYRKIMTCQVYNSLVAEPELEFKSSDAQAQSVGHIIIFKLVVISQLSKRGMI